MIADFTDSFKMRWFFVEIIGFELFAIKLTVFIFISKELQVSQKHKQSNGSIWNQESSGGIIQRKEMIGAEFPKGTNEVLK